LAYYYHYTPKPLDKFPIDGIILPPQTGDLIFNFEVFNKYGSFSAMNGLYLTPKRYSEMDSKTPRDDLAVTFTPRHGLVFDMAHPKNSGVIHYLRNPFGGKSPSRIWPAYGKRGGGFEIILMQADVGLQMDTPITFKDEVIYDRWRSGGIKADKKI